MHLLNTYGAPRGVTTLPEPSDYFLTSTLVSGWVPTLFRPTRGGKVEERMLGRPPPAKPLVLYSYEGNQASAQTHAPCPCSLRHTHIAPARFQPSALASPVACCFQFCRLAREALCELDLPYEMRSTGKGSPRRDELMTLSGKTTAPFIVDPNTGGEGGTAMGESADIVEYLWATYGA